MKIKALTTVIDLQHPQVMGVVNVTPDSFSDGGRFFDRDTAIRQAEAMVSEGATIVDIGGESTRPGAEKISSQEELDRVMPVLEGITRRLDVVISIDTSTPLVMAAAAEAGVGLINDVFALREPGALAAAAATGCAICLMHMQGRPREMQANPAYQDVVSEVGSFLRERVAVCVGAGIDVARLIVDPGFGFGKTDRHNLELLAKLDRLDVCGLPILAGLSRKRTLGNLTGRAAGERLAASIAAAGLAVDGGASIIRTHDVAATVDALKIAAAVREVQTRDKTRVDPDD